jgi:DNA-binding NtrC family response regulator
MSDSDGRYPGRKRRYPPERGARDHEALLRRLAPSRATVLLVHGSADVMARVARELHDRSPRHAQPFVTVDCAALAPTVIEEVLFGPPSYGAVARSTVPRRQRGAVGDAGGGTLYMAAIDALPMFVQPQFLRFLDEPRTVRVFASSAVELVPLVRRGRFRADLAERLSLACVDLAHQV